MCSEKSLKYTLVIICIIIMLAGAAALAIGVWNVVGAPTAEPLLGAELHDIVSYLMIGGGALAVVVSLVGCCGAARGNKCKLLTFAIIIFIALAVMLSGAVLVFVTRDKVDKKLHMMMFDTIPKYGEISSISKMWDSIQNFFQCCGLQNSSTDDSYTIWRKMNSRFSSGNSVPESCCKKKDNVSIQECQKSPSTETYNVDCYVKAKEFLKEHAYLLAGLAVAVCFVFVTGIVLSCILFCRI